ncbi:MAG: SDR family NAD(P)-dependent oxidoreductase, partial [Gammaproteobacteria bacterium]|nr:SDR family NAD(P)-dependent oxidoreductase [Gammaproteobacteria bacterium]
MTDTAKHSEKSGNDNAVLVVGASGGIGSALVRRYLDSEDYAAVFAVSRANSVPAEFSTNSLLRWTGCDHNQNAIDRVIADIVATGLNLRRTIICTGILHNNQLMPEKSLDDIKLENLQEVFNVNLHIPALWIAALVKYLPRSSTNVVAALSARVGSIADNRLGGWYSYRSSKAGLNMFLKSAAIEYARRAPKMKLVAFHPGTTDTGLSKP